MIFNVIDRRKQPYRWKRLNAIIEATSQDNFIPDADEVEPAENDVTYDEYQSVSLQDAIAWANAQAGPVTLFLYDEGEGC